MLTKFASSALLFFALTHGAVAIVCGDPPLPACPTFAPCAPATNSAASHSGATPFGRNLNIEMKASDDIEASRDRFHIPVDLGRPTGAQSDRPGTDPRVARRNDKERSLLVHANYWLQGKHRWRDAEFSPLVHPRDNPRAPPREACRRCDIHSRPRWRHATRQNHENLSRKRLIYVLTSSRAAFPVGSPTSTGWRPPAESTPDSPTRMEYAPASIPGGTSSNGSDNKHSTDDRVGGAASQGPRVVGGGGQNEGVEPEYQ
ncbi:hypothetical protein FB451DRAFT_1180425 [Mycena latifolia]|nr:hypothetical protein FB451DRAFT_1180425 [Mycena latifolia]